MNPTNLSTNEKTSEKLPKASLFALFFSGFVSLLTEALPAGLLPEMSRSLHITASLTGQTVTIYALATALGAIPLARLTATWSRKRVVQTALAIVFIADLLTAFSPFFVLTLLIRFIAGLGTAMIWPILGGYASSISPEASQGKAVALALAGNPVGLALGIPMGAALGKMLDWQLVFLIAAGLVLLNFLWNFHFLIDVAGRKPEHQSKLGETFAIRGFKPILFALSTYMVAHNIVYTYITDYLGRIHLENQASLILFTFGVASILSVLLVGSLIDRYVRRLTLLSASLLAFAMLLLSVFTESPFVIYLASGLWGLVFGSSASLFIHSAIRATGKHADMAQALVVTAFSGSISIGAFSGGLLISLFGTLSISWAAFALLILSALTVFFGKKFAFPVK
ncbi:MFS transporter [Lactococcus allomyrinae]|uniref:MFS transporter n=1 Tax=Lactococcus allomyrinae TaxID=2419773 RepID=A0A387BBN2_9LACT|nr:MFS transporter [Lactococcus allomyrinae]AYG01255.1 MFS transporter [Lactococcus allomyrinae]